LRSQLAVFYEKEVKMIRRKLLGILMGAIIFGLCFTSQVMATEQDMSAALVAEELKTLSNAVDNLSRQIAKQSGNAEEETTLRKLDIAIAYLNFRSRRIEMFERDLQSSRASRNRIEDVLEQFQREENSLSQSFDSNQQDAMQKAREELRFRQQAIKDRGSRLDEEIILLENRIMDMRSQLDSVESFVQKNLQFYR
jgi:predicted  nucleic acid-binding Zn-ribbon protein